MQQLLGHASLASTQIYTHVSADRMRSAYENAHPRAESEVLDEATIAEQEATANAAALQTLWTDYKATGERPIVTA